MGTTWVGRVLAWQALALVLLFTRWPLLPAHLTNFDNANFAFALADFNPAEHKPQPPGYALYVGLAKVMHLVIADSVLVFFLTGLIGSCIAILMTRELARDLFGEAAGWIAAALLLFHPVLWSDGIMNPVRVFLAAGAACVGWLAWRAWNPGSHRVWFFAAAGVLGLASGFRLTLLPLYLPLVCVAGFRRRSSFVDWAVATALLVAGVGSWLGVTILESGGLQSYAQLISGYTNEQFSGSSLLFGATAGAALDMVKVALVWAVGPALAWLWAAPFIRRQQIREAWSRTGIFLALWLVPPLLLSTVVHAAEPGHVLPVVVPICTLGAFAIANIGLRKRAPGAWIAAGLAASVAISAGLFFRPVTRTQWRSSALSIRDASARLESSLALVEEAAQKGPLTILVSPSSAVSWRVLSFYYPKTLLAVMLTDPGPDSLQPPSHYLVRGTDLESSGGDSFEVPGCGSMLWLRSPNSETSLNAMPPLDQRAAGTAVIADLRGGTSIRLRPYNIRAAAVTCSPVLSLRNETSHSDAP